MKRVIIIFILGLFLFQGIVQAQETSDENKCGLFCKFINFFKGLFGGGSSGLEEEPSNADESYTVEIVAEHNSNEDCWMIIKEKVYDATEFVLSGKHPKPLGDLCGQDITDKFKHPDEKLNVLNYLGDLK